MVVYIFIVLFISLITQSWMLPLVFLGVPAGVIALTLAPAEVVGWIFVAAALLGPLGLVIYDKSKGGHK